MSTPFQHIDNIYFMCNYADMEKFKYQQDLKRERVKRGEALLLRNLNGESQQAIAASFTPPISRQCVHALIQCAIK